MEINENIAGLGKDHDESANKDDLAKKQSQAEPATENLDMMPNSINKHGNKAFSDSKKPELHDKAADYAKEEHNKAKNWGNFAKKEDGTA